VFRAHHVLLKQDVAIKILHPDRASDQSIAKRFEREARSASMLSHPNCVEVSEFGVADGGLLFMVMELLDGTELQEVFHGAVPPGRATELILQVVAGLSHAHDHGVIHRDLKPQNVFVTRKEDGTEVLKLFDFGIAKLVGAEAAGEAKTQTGLIFGTPLYMSPEQALGMEVDARSDLYAVGVLLYEMLAGHVPFQSEDPVALIRMQVSAEPPALPERVPPQLSAIVMRLLAKRREDRFPDSRTVRKVLSGFLKSYRERFGDDDNFIPDDEPIPGISAAATLAPGDLPTIRASVGALPASLQPRPQTFTNTVFTRTRSSRTWVVLLVLIVACGGGLFVCYQQNIWRPGWLDPVFGGLVAQEPATEVQTDPQEVPADSKNEGDAKGLAAEALADFDAALVGGDYKKAAELLAPLREQFPDDPELMWRAGKILARKRATQKDALAMYAEALSRDPNLLSNLGFFTELDRLLGKPNLREPAIEVALNQLGVRGHGRLIDFLADDKRVQSYENRHRILKALETTEESWAKVDLKAELNRDFDQYAKTEQPCVTLTASLGGVLKHIENDAVDESFVDRLSDKNFRLPKPKLTAPEEE
ncbi:MAG: protein kinase domain-containing protein, partial [Nannocystaceae bacterium]